jgi:hypothetical protein
MLIIMFIIIINITMPVNWIDLRVLLVYIFESYHLSP